uniref:Uncharacterized protein n=1 Tax=Erwinia amylovora ATCC BAA-2158 TaxID=889211 RepID=E5B1Q2_ERWAM|nr:hypothetical protein predicted by Glimmer/Critica [Erwinia amylovora ATCC BAA-2158]
MCSIDVMGEIGIVFFSIRYFIMLKKDGAWYEGKLIL